MTDNEITLEQIIEKLTSEAYKSWGGEIGKERAERVKNLLDRVLPNWSEKIGISQLEILKNFEATREVNVINHYQDSKFPLLDNVDVYETLADFKAMHKGLGFVCPSCKGTSLDPQECNADPDSCTWKSYGFFKCLGDGYKFTIKELFQINEGQLFEIFKPVALINLKDKANG